MIGFTELGALVSIHQEKQDQNEEPLTLDEVLIIQGALSMRNKVVEDAHMPLESVFMLDIRSKMDADCIQRVSKRIAVLEVTQCTRGALCFCCGALCKVK